MRECTSSSEFSAHLLARDHTPEGFIDDASGVWMHMDTGARTPAVLSRGERHGVQLASPVTLRQEWFWQVRSFWSSHLPSGMRSSRWWWLNWEMPSHVSLRRLSEEFHFLRCGAHCAVRTWKYGAFFLFVLVSSRHFPCLGVACGVQVLDSWRDCFRDCWKNFTHFGAVDSDPEASWSPCSCRMETCAQSMLQLAVLF